MQKSKLFTYIIAIVLTVFVGGAFAVGANWVAPTGQPPVNNAETPLNVSGTAQTKTGSLTIGSDLTVTGRICLGGVCLNAWPEATTVTPPPPAGTVVNGVCGLSSGRTFATAPTADLCSSGTASAVSNSGSTWSWLCNGSGGGISSPCNATRETGWVAVATAHKPAQGTNETWATEKVTSWTANGPIAGIRVSGDADDGGYCYASWGTGHVETYRHDPSIGVYNVNNGYYDGLPIYNYNSFVPEPRPRVLTTDSEGGSYYACPSGAIDQYDQATDTMVCVTCPTGQSLQFVGDYESGQWACYAGNNTCPTNPPTFTNTGSAKICQIPWSAGAFATKSLSGLYNVLAGTVFTLKSNFVDGPVNGHVNCTMEALYK